MKRRSSFLVFLGLLLASPLALANDQHTVSFGYAQTHLSSLKNSDSKDLRGFNFKYRYEFNETWGMLGSFTATRNEMENYTWKEGKLHKNGSEVYLSMHHGKPVVSSLWIPIHLVSA